MSQAAPHYCRGLQGARRGHWSAQLFRTAEEKEDILAPFHRTKPFILTLVGALAASSLALSGCTGPDNGKTEVSSIPSPTIRAGVLEAAKAGADWLKGQLKEDSYLEGKVGETTRKDVGLSIDALLAFRAAEEWDAAKAVAAWVSQPGALDDYASDQKGMTYPGAIAKTGLALSLDSVTYPDGNAAQREMLAKRLVARLQDNGRFTDDSNYADTSNPITQSLAVMFLLKQGLLADQKADPVKYLVEAACEDGSFPDSFDAPGNCFGSVDATAYVMQSLVLIPEQNEVVNKAAEWLIAQQTEQGQWNGWNGPSVTSTALAVLALGDLKTGPANIAVSNGWTALATWQMQNGGWPADNLGQEADVRATPQAVQGTAQTSLGVLVGLKEQ